jgi:hypothetical protein
MVSHWGWRGDCHFGQAIRAWMQDWEPRNNPSCDCRAFRCQPRNSWHLTCVSTLKSRELPIAACLAQAVPDVFKEVGTKTLRRAVPKPEQV